MKIVNIRQYGGIAEAVRAGVVYCGRPSPLGNPFRADHPTHRHSNYPVTLVRTVGEAISRYGIWLRERVRARDQAVIQALNNLNEESTLGCWCAPRPCHCEIIAQVWQEIQRGDFNEKA